MNIVICNIIIYFIFYVFKKSKFVELEFHASGLSPYLRGHKTFHSMLSPFKTLFNDRQTHFQHLSHRIGSDCRVTMLLLCPDINFIKFGKK